MFSIYNVVIKIGEKDESRVATALNFYFQSAPKNCTLAEQMINFPRTTRELKATEKISYNTTELN